MRDRGEVFRAQASAQAVQQKAICVTCNYEARAFGVTKLQFIKEAIRLCPGLVLVSGEDLTPFRAVSDAVLTLLRSSFTHVAQRLGMDEVFLDVTELVDALERDCPFRPGAPSGWQSWAGHVHMPEVDAVEHTVPLSELALGWTTGTGALRALEAAASGSAGLGERGALKGRLTASQAQRAARSAEPAWSAHAPSPAEAAAPEAAADGGGGAPEPSDAVPCPDARARWAPTPVTLLPASAAPGRVEHRLRLASALAARVRHAVASRLGVRCCAGVGASKLAAKFAVNLRKPASQSVMLPGAMPSFLATLRVRALPGVGHRATRALEDELGVRRVPDVLVLPPGRLAAALGSEASAARVIALARGIDASPVTPSGPPRTISDEDSFKGISGDGSVAAELERIAADLLPRLDADAARFGRRPCTLRFGLRCRDERRVTRQQPFPDAVLVTPGADGPDAVRRASLLAEASMRLYRAAVSGRTVAPVVSLLSIGASSFTEATRGTEGMGQGRATPRLATIDAFLGPTPASHGRGGHGAAGASAAEEAVPSPGRRPGAVASSAAVSPAQLASPSDGARAAGAPPRAAAPVARSPAKRPASPLRSRAKRGRGASSRGGPRQSGLLSFYRRGDPIP